MGGAPLNGYYHITAIIDGYDSGYDAKEYIIAYWDLSSSSKSSRIFNETNENNNVSNVLYVADRRIKAESGFVYDPSVPSDDTYFGNSDVCYSFSTENTAADFLAVYIADLRYWAQPVYSGWPNTCAEVAGAIILSYWDRKGYDLIPYDWQDDWQDNPVGEIGYPVSQDTPASYVAFIAELATYMYYTEWTGTITFLKGLGLDDYAADRGYEGFTSNFEDNLIFDCWSTL